MNLNIKVELKTVRIMSEPQEIRKDPKTGSYPIIKGVRSRFTQQCDPKIVLPKRDFNWSSNHKGLMIAVYAIAIVFAFLIIGAVFAS